MADGLVKMSDQFGGLPMDQLIGGPLKAACDSQVQLAKATADFIQNVGLEADSNGVLRTRTVDFVYNKPVNDGGQVQYL
jgi:glycyl-tRNA synthetase beta subunit